MSSEINLHYLEDLQEELSNIRRDLEAKLAETPEKSEKPAKPQRFHVSHGLLESINRKTGKSSENEPLEWNDLPPEMKIKCIEQCDFKSRCHVAMTCHNEKALVERAKPISWSSVSLKMKSSASIPSLGSAVLLATSEMGGVLRRKWEYQFHPYFGMCGNKVETDKSLKKLTTSLLHILKKSGRVKSFRICESEMEDCPPPEFAMQLLPHVPFQYEEFWMSNGRKSVVTQFFLSQCLSQMRRVRIGGVVLPQNDAMMVPGHEYMVMWDEFKAKSLQYDIRFKNISDYMTCFGAILEKWIRDDVEIGTRLLFLVSFDKTSLLLKFIKQLTAETIAYSNFLLRTPSDGMPRGATKPKSILIREEIVDSKRYLSCVVIPTKLRPSEYENAGDWFWRKPAI